MKYYLKKASFSLIYLIFMDAIALGINQIDAKNTALKLILLCVNLAFYIFLIGSLAFKDGEDALNVRVANDIDRKEMVKTGVVKKLRLTEEYKPYKGFLIGLVTCIPLIIFMAIHAIFYFSGSEYLGMGAIVDTLYNMITSFYKVFVTELNSIDYFFALIALPVISLTTGIPYIIGGKRRERIQLRIEAQQRELYGDKK